MANANEIQVMEGGCCRQGGVSEWQLHLAVQPLKWGRGRGRVGGVVGVCVPATLYTSLSMPSGCGYSRAAGGGGMRGEGVLLEWVCRWVWVSLSICL